ncbi:DUF6453 family protein [Rouxiella sp. T17]|uniref:DUF6453 family protein n=1 Tax=Rouxiella sp. T17 TaxID=3085684 RepID=UPI002FC720C2
MSTYGLVTYGSNGKAYGMNQTKPLCYLGSMTGLYKSASNNTISQNFSGRCPADATLVAIPEYVLGVAHSTVYTTVKVQPISISINGLTVTASFNADQGDSYQISTPRPNNINVFCIYNNTVSLNGFGLYTSDAGAFPSVVDSTQGMFLSYQNSFTFTGSFAVPVASGSIVFAGWDNANIGLQLNQNNMTITGWQNGSTSGISTAMKICAFSIKQPVMPSYGMAIYGADNRLSFTSYETPMLHRGYINTPALNNDSSSFSAADWAQQPMIPLFGAIGLEKQTFDFNDRNLSMGGGILSTARGKGLGAGGSTSPNVQVVYNSRPLPFLWSTDYF